MTDRKLNIYYYEINISIAPFRIYKYYKKSIVKLNMIKKLLKVNGFKHIDFLIRA